MAAGCDASGKFGQMSAFLKLQIICDNRKLRGMHDNSEKVHDVAVVLKMDVKLSTLIKKGEAC